MGQLTEAMAAKIAGFRTDIKDALLADLNAHEDVDGIAAPGALDLAILVSEISVDGTDAFTIAAPTRTGQRKIARCVAAANTPLGTLTVSSPDDTAGFVCPATFVFTTVGQEVTLEATAALKWRCVDKKRAGAKAVVVGTTELAGHSLHNVYQLSVTNTVSSATTMGLPNGAVVGERCILINTAVSGSPIGNVDGTFAGMNGTAYTHMGTIGVAASSTLTGDFAEVRWNGATWQVMNFSGITWS